MIEYAGVPDCADRSEQLLASWLHGGTPTSSSCRLAPKVLETPRHRRSGLWMRDKDKTWRTSEVQAGRGTGSGEAQAISALRPMGRL